MAVVKLYCTADDVEQILPKLVTTDDEASGDKVIRDEFLDAYCLRASSAIDYALSQNGYKTPIDFGVKGDSNYNQLIDETLKTAALNGVAGMVLRANNKLDNQFETNYYELMFTKDLNNFIIKGLPGIDKEYATPKVLAPSGWKWKNKPYFSPQGPNYDAN